MLWGQGRGQTVRHFSQYCTCTCMHVPITAQLMSSWNWREKVPWKYFSKIMIKMAILVGCIQGKRVSQINILTEDRLLQKSRFGKMRYYSAAVFSILHWLAQGCYIVCVFASPCMRSFSNTSDPVLIKLEKINDASHRCSPHSYN